MNNPLLDFSDLPLFDQIAPGDVAAAVDLLIQQSSEALEAVVQADFPAQWSAIAQRLDVTTEKLTRAWGAVSHLNGVPPTTKPCPRSLNSGHGWARTSACTPSTRPWTRPR